VTSTAFTLKVNHNRLVTLNGVQEMLNLLYPGFNMKDSRWDIRTPLK